MSYPNDRKYSADHEWVLGEGGEVTIGISEYAAHALGDVVYVDLPAVGDAFSAGDSFGEIESVKSVSELFMPVSGSITAVNDALEGAPETVNADPYGDGWMVKVSVSNPSEVAELLDAATYEAEAAS